MSSGQHRKFIILSGDSEWCHSALQGLSVGQETTWITQHPPAGAIALPADRTAKLLGGELSVLVFDAHSGFNPDALGAASGVVRGGGLFILLLPHLERWNDLTDPESRRIKVHGYEQQAGNSRFLRRMIGLIRSSGDVHLIEQQDYPESAALVTGESVSAPGVETPGTEDQNRAVDAVVRVATGHRRRPVVMVADRGRGKSAALGMAAARLLLGGKRRILVTAPRLSATRALFDHATRLLPGSNCSGSKLEFQVGVIDFVAPDDLLAHPREADLVLVDEAAAIPAPLLESLLRRHARIAFATTVHGYEGTGRGFAVRFRDVLDQVTPQWREIFLRQPIRWAEGDPLERFTFQALLLDAEPAREDRVGGAAVDNIRIELLDRDRLLQEEDLLKQVFGLLVSAHYRTTPVDLRNLLDGPNMRIWAASYQGNVVASALVAREGRFDTELAEQVWMGFRRPRGHLLPETLAAHAGLKTAPLLDYQRVIRIAVHPAVRSRGIGQALLGQIVALAGNEGQDALGVSFGATADLIRFWRHAGFEPVRLGITREARSGAHSVVMLHPVSPAALELHAEARTRFMRQFPLLLSGHLDRLNADIVSALLASLPASQFPVLPETDLQDLYTFAAGNRDEADVIAGLRELAILAVATRCIDTEGLDLLIYRVLQHRSWGEIAGLTGGTGRKELIKLMRREVSMCLSSLQDRANIRQAEQELTH